MQVKINGKSAELNDGINLEEAIIYYKINPETVVVELNQKIIKKKDWKEITIKETDEIEIISFVGGG